MKTKAFILLLSVFVLNAHSKQPAQLIERTVPLQFQFPPFEVVQGTRGVRFQSKGFLNVGHPGDMALPVTTIRYFLPPKANLESVRVVLNHVNVTKIRPGLVAPISSARVGANPEKLPRKDGLPLHDGFNAQQYALQDFYPASFLRRVRVETWRGFKVVSIQLYGARANPSTGEAELAQSIMATLSFNEDPAVQPVPAIASAHQIAQMLGRFSPQSSLDVLQQYADVLPPYALFDYDLLIVTDEDIWNDRSENGLSRFITHKRAMGFQPIVKTVEDIAVEYSGSTRQEKIRECIFDMLQKYGIDYVLLVGNPDYRANDEHALHSDPAVVPMWKCYIDTRNENLEVSMTDLLYADLNDSYDSSDTYIDWDDIDTADVLVGRIAPVGGYVDVVVVNGETNTLAAPDKLKAVFDQAVLHDLELDTDWRSNMLVAASYIWGWGEANGAYLIKRTIERMCREHSPLYAHTYFQSNSVTGDEFFDGRPNPEAEGPLVDGTPGTFMEQYRTNSYGLIFWLGHGTFRSAGIGYDDSDAGNFITRARVFNSDWRNPAVIFSVACNNLEVGTQRYEIDADYASQLSCWANLGAMLQYKGSVAFGGYTGPAVVSDNNEDDEVGMATHSQREFLAAVVEGCVANPKTFGEAFWGVQDDIWSCYADDPEDYPLANKLRMTLLGDPSQMLFANLDDYPDDDFEENDERADAALVYDGTAEGLDPNSHYDISVYEDELTSKDRDWFRITGLGTRPKSFAICLDTTSTYEYVTAPPFDLTAQVYNSAGTELGVFKSGVDGLYAYYEGSRETRSEELYVRVNHGRYVMPNYRLSMSIFSEDDYEDNDTVDVATDLGVGPYVSLSGLASFDHDCFHIVGTSPYNTVRFWIPSYAHAGNHIYAYNSRGDCVGFTTNCTFYGSFYGSDIYVCVAYGDRPTVYSVSATVQGISDDAFDVSGDNDNIGSATWVGDAGTYTEGTYTCSATCDELFSADDDWYQIIDEDCEQTLCVFVTLTYTPYDDMFGSGPRIEIYDDEGTLIPWTSSTTSDGFVSASCLFPGAKAKYLKVIPAGEYPTDYSFTTSITTKPTLWH